LVVSNINTNVQTNLLTMVEDLGSNKYATNDISMNAYTASILLKLFFFSMIFIWVVTFHPNTEQFFPH